jgi:aminobutyraldehyde dehydrogenase
MEQTVQTSLLIGGEFVPGAGDVEDVLNPATGDTIARIAEASLDQVQAAVAAASRAFPAWAKTVPKDRANLLLKLADAIEARATEFARLESLNCGKPYLGALNDEIPAVADVFRFFRRRMPHPARTARRRIFAGIYQHGATRSARRGGIDRALELSVDDGRLEDRAGSGGG